MASCPNISKHLKVQQYSPTKTVVQLLDQLRNPKMTTKAKQLKPELDVNLIRSQMKKKWRDPGYANVEFTKPPIIRAKLLNEWEYERIFQAERSYKFPKDFKGIKFDSHSRRFEQPTREMLPLKFNTYLDKVKSQYEQKLFTPDNTMSNKKQRIMRMLTENATKSATNREFLRSGFFGYSTRKKLRTVNNE